MQLLSQVPSVTEVAPPDFLTPLAGFDRLSERVLQWIDRKLGYFGASRFVFFYYEPRGQEVMWNDGRSYGFGSGGWMAFGDEVAPVAARHGVDLGDESHKGRQVLLLDRTKGDAYFADRRSAERFVHAHAARQ